MRAPPALGSGGGAAAVPVASGEGEFDGRARVMVGVSPDLARDFEPIRTRALDPVLARDLTGNPARARTRGCSAG
ncbi:hypothetical protein [Streptomyces sp. NPDC055681]